MDLTDAISTVRKELIEEGGMLHRIALYEGIDLKAANRLKTALKSLADYYKDKNDIPKKLAAAFIDLTPLFERSIDMYSEIEQEQIEDIRNDIVSLAVDLFS
ncbi:hypothetical protein [Spartinivicinus poritis]|uniref:Uncharacterized protein n=1 Tax=Spartinivicinus poritis TaxID=2994640 RepID=A0ABT5UD21_9GAMM|nr:hypothetical protein [Spartinivicinus sp. A2-2]MDE1464274.1 hypothetical protein [Spartinivicinus sp. A2-2]